MTEIETTIFKCDHCGKRQFRKCDMVRHEKWCKENPSNKHKCFEMCQHLVKTEEQYIIQGEDGYVSKKTIFTCNVNSQRMFSFIAERKKLPVVNETGVVRMPLQCDDYEGSTTEVDINLI